MKRLIFIVILGGVLFALWAASAVVADRAAFVQAQRGGAK